MAEFEKKLRKILKKRGCFFVRHGKIKSRYIANAILKQAGLPDRFE